LRASFELNLLASTLIEAKKAAYEHISSFLECEPSDVPDRADVELRIKTIDIGEDTKKPLWSESTDLYEITVYGTLKQGVVRPL
jgi:hypothetical protein